MAWVAVLTFGSRGIPQRMSDDEEEVDESRKQAAEKSLRPDIQAGALRMKEGDEPPEEQEHPSYRETSDEESGDRGHPGRSDDSE